MGDVGLPTKIVALGVGAASAWGVEELSSRLFPAKRAELGGLGLTIAAVIYPAARRRHWAGAASFRELAGVGVAAGLSAAALAQAADARKRQVIAAGWVAHSVFDKVHRAGPGGRLPGWYAALCAGYDLAFAAMLLRDRAGDDDQPDIDPE